MNDLVNSVINDDFLFNAIKSHIRGRSRTGGKQFLNINCPVCTSRGEGADRRLRCGIKNNHPGLGIHCFNCSFKTKWVPGTLLSRDLKLFLSCLGVDETTIQQLAFKAFSYRSFLSGQAETPKRLLFQPNFPPMDLPEGAMTFEQWADEGNTNQDFIETVEYVLSRGNDVFKHNFYWSPVQNRRVIIPFYFKGKIVGWSSRAIDNEGMRYIKHSPENYIFNSDQIFSDKKYLIVVEGLFDALAIDGLGLMSSTLNGDQIDWIKSTGKTIVVVPDRDHKGQQIIDIALKERWHVAFPSLRDSHGTHHWWSDDCKDVADAVKKYGRLYTLISILESATNNKIETNLKRRYLA